MHKDFNNPKGGAELMRLNFKTVVCKDRCQEKANIADPFEKVCTPEHETGVSCGYQYSSHLQAASTETQLPE